MQERKADDWICVCACVCVVWVGSIYLVVRVLLLSLFVQEPICVFVILKVFFGI